MFLLTYLVSEVYRPASRSEYRENVCFRIINVSSWGYPMHGFKKRQKRERERERARQE